MPYPNISAKGSGYHTVESEHDLVAEPYENVNNVGKRPKRPSTSVMWLDIAWNTFFLTIPMLVLTCILFSFIFGYRVTSTVAPFERLRGSNSSSQLSNDAFFVDLNSTFLVFIASWMSSLAPMLASFAIALAAYPVAERLYHDTMQYKRENLLTPFQLHLTLRLITGSTWVAIWNMLLYRLGWGKGSKRQGTALTSLFRLTCMVVLLR